MSSSSLSVNRNFLFKVISKIQLDFYNLNRNEYKNKKNKDISKIYVNLF